MIEQRQFLSVAHTPYKIVGWMCLIVFTFCTIMAVWVSAFGAALFFLLLVCLAVYILLGSGSMTVDEKDIYYTLPLANYKIGWQEVKYVEVDKQFSSLVFVGENKRLAVNGVTAWKSKNRQKMIEFLLKQMSHNSIEFKQTEWAMWRRSKNTKVSRDGNDNPTNQWT